MIAICSPVLFILNAKNQFFIHNNKGNVIT